MEALLIDSWLHGLAPVPTLDEASVSLVRERVRSEGARLGLPEVATASLVTVASELAHNQLRHARSGQIAVRAVERDGVAGLEVVAADAGGGIADPTLALRGSGSREDSVGLGVGLAGARSLADELDFDVRRGEGTCVWARKFATPVRRRREVGIFGRPHPAERISGDHAAFVRHDDALAMTVVDGLGHGPDARTAASTAIRRFLEVAAHAPDAILAACHDALTATRGAVMSVTRVEEPAGELATASVGNVSVYVCGPQVAHRFGGSSAVVGLRGASRTVRVERLSLAARDAILMFSDGITGRASLDGELDLLREPPIVIAHALVTRFARADDDVLVLVLR